MQLRSKNLVNTSAEDEKDKDEEDKDEEDKDKEEKDEEDKDEEDKCDPASGDKDCYYPSGSMRTFRNDQMHYTLGLLFVSTFLGFMW